MSTRSHIIVTDEKTTHYVYHHCDGYLDGVGAELKDFANNFAKSEYYKNSDNFCKELENWDDSYEYEDCGPHGDEEYLYTVKIKEGTIEVSAQELHCTKIDTGWKEDWVAVPEFTQTFTADIPPISSDKEVISDMMDDFEKELERLATIEGAKAISHFVNREQSKFAFEWADLVKEAYKAGYRKAKSE